MSGRHYHHNYYFIITLLLNCIAEDTNAKPSPAVRTRSVPSTSIFSHNPHSQRSTNGSLTLQAISVLSVFLFINIRILAIYLRRNSVCTGTRCRTPLSFNGTVPWVRERVEHPLFGFGIYLYRVTSYSNELFAEIIK